MDVAFENRPPHVAALDATLHWSGEVGPRWLMVLLGIDWHRANVAQQSGHFDPIEPLARKVTEEKWTL